MLVLLGMAVGDTNLPELAAQVSQYLALTSRMRSLIAVELLCLISLGQSSNCFAETLAVGTSPYMGLTTRQAQIATLALLCQINKGP